MKKYENFCAALKNLEDIHLYQEPYDKSPHPHPAQICKNLPRKPQINITNPSIIPPRPGTKQNYLLHIIFLC